MSQWPDYDKIVILTAADDFDFDGDFPKVPQGQRLVKIFFTIKRDPDDTDAAALFQRVVTITPDADGNAITADGSANVRRGFGKASFHILIPRAVTVALPIGPDLPYDVQATSSADRDATIEKGVIRVRDQVTISR